MNVTKSQFDPGEKFSFVCSQLLASQLVNTPVLHLGPIAAKKFGRTFNALGAGREEAALTEAIGQQLVSVPAAHIDHLRRLVKDNGAVHYADTFTAMDNGRLGVMLAPAMVPHIESRFNLLREIASWEFWALPDLGYKVVSFGLAPKLNQDSK